MALKFNCPKCGNEVEFKFLMSGESGKCPKCNQEIVISNDATQVGDGPSEIAKGIAKKIAAKKDANIGALLIKRGLLICVIHLILVISLTPVYPSPFTFNQDILLIILHIMLIILLVPGIICIPLLMLIGQGNNGFLIFLISTVTYSLLGAYLLSIGEIKRKHLTSSK